MRWNAVRETTKGVGVEMWAALPAAKRWAADLSITRATGMRKARCWLIIATLWLCPSGVAAPRGLDMCCGRGRVGPLGLLQGLLLPGNAGALPIRAC